MNALIKALGPVKRRIRANRLLRGAAAGLAAGLGAAALLQAVSFFTPVPDRGLYGLLIAAAAAAAAALGNASRPVGNRTAAEAADACGLKERTITALETDGGLPIHELQRQDALKALEGLDPRGIRPGSVRKWLLAALGCAVLFGALLLIQSPQDGDAAARKALAKTLQEGRETIRAAEAQDEEKLTEKEKSELRKITEELNRELGESRDAADALVAMDRAQQRIEQMQQKTAGDAEAAAAEGEGAGADAGTDANAQAGQTEASAQGAEGQAQAGAAGQATDAQLQTLQALASLRSHVNPSASAAMAGTTAGMGSQGTRGEGGQAAGGSGTGEKAGGGAGTGTTNEEQQAGSNSKSGHVAGSRDPEYKEAEYETIYDPERIERSKQDVLTNQERLGDEGSQQLQTGPGKGSVQGDVPWTDAVGEYAQAEAQAADRENLTPRERQWVTDYFMKLTEQK